MQISDIDNFVDILSILFFDIDNLPIISEMSIYRLSIIFFRYYRPPLLTVPNMCTGIPSSIICVRQTDIFLSLINQEGFHFIANPAYTRCSSPCPCWFWMLWSLYPLCTQSCTTWEKSNKLLLNLLDKSALYSLRKLILLLLLLYSLRMVSRAERWTGF